MAKVSCKLAFLMNSEAGISIVCVVNFEEDRLPTRFKSGFHYI